MATAKTYPSDIVLMCGCCRGKNARKWTLCEQAEKLYLRWRNTQKIEAHDQYQKHFRV